MRLTLSILLLCALASKASADWQYTKWGMTPNQVVAASSGAASLSAPSTSDDGNKSNLAIEAHGTYNAGPFKFLTVFDFDKTNNGLREVALLMPHPDKLDDLRRALEEKYGPWTGTEWIDRASNCSVEWQTIGDVAIVTYRPLSPNNSGL